MEETSEQWQRRIRVAQGIDPADTVLSGAKVLNVFTQQLVAADVAIVDGRIAGVGSYPDAHSRVDLAGSVIAPSFIDAHIHLESTMLWVPQFVQAVVPHGSGAVMADPHEIANVSGLQGVAAMRDAARGLPIDIRWAAPSCVPASALESPGSTFDIDDIRDMLAWPETYGLGEMMNFPAVLEGEPDIFGKLDSARHLPRDGHSPGLTGAAVNAYAAAGIQSDHESTSRQEAWDKLSAGMMLVLREGTSEKNALELLPLVTDATWWRCTFGSDDRDAHDLRSNGHVDAILRTVIEAGLDPIRAITMASWNASLYARLEGIGAVAPGYRANLVVLDADLQNLTVRETWHQGTCVARDGHMLAPPKAHDVPDALAHSVRVAPIHLSDLRLGPADATNAVGLVPHQIVTECRSVEPTVVNGAVVSAPERDLLKLVCVERHHATGRVGVGLLHGLGLQRGAIAGSIGHDAHNIMAAGANDVDLLTAIATVADMQGGLAVVCDGNVVATLALPIAGLMSNEPLDDVAAAYDGVEAAARSLGSNVESPFGQLAFLGLSVIPAARVTDRGFLDLRL